MKMKMTNNGKIIVGISVAAIGFVLYKQYMANIKINNAVNQIDLGGNGGNIEAPCKNIAPYLKQCKGKSSGWLCQMAAPYQKICAPYV
jgi:hypothetical protein